jgi:hypothetical protein
MLQQQKEKQQTQLNISLTTQGDLKIQVPNPEHLTSEQYLFIQQAIDESRERSKAYSQLQELVRRDFGAQGFIGFLFVFSLLTLVSFLTVRSIKQTFFTEPVSFVQRVSH